MSITDTRFIFQTFAPFRIEEGKTAWSLSTAATNRTMKVTELIIRSPAR